MTPQTPQNTIHFNPNNRYIRHLFSKVESGEFSFFSNDLSGLDDSFFDKTEYILNDPETKDTDFIEFTHAGLFWYFQKNPSHNNEYKIDSEILQNLLFAFTANCLLESLRRKSIIHDPQDPNTDIFNHQSPHLAQPTPFEHTLQLQRYTQATTTPLNS